MTRTKCNLQLDTPRGVVTVTGWDSWESYFVNLDVTILTETGATKQETWFAVPSYVIEYLGLAVTPTYTMKQEKK